ncbi:hypothetical protein DE146DRAFT_651057 [Phaeosphaeria sp. MPI-PUGE-AT-0046c]|nr:hypothetical protein DE146DRAFT_651057 [Phaeosphaeria sp. MPI-PUGE-AT-0046c]
MHRQLRPPSPWPNHIPNGVRLRSEPASPGLRLSMLMRFASLYRPKRRHYGGAEDLARLVLCRGRVTLHCKWHLTAYCGLPFDSIAACAASLQQHHQVVYMVKSQTTCPSSPIFQKAMRNNGPGRNPQRRKNRRCFETAVPVLVTISSGQTRPARCTREASQPCPIFMTLRVSAFDAFDIYLLAPNLVDFRKKGGRKAYSKSTTLPTRIPVVLSCCGRTISRLHTPLHLTAHSPVGMSAFQPQELRSQRMPILSTSFLPS